MFVSINSPSWKTVGRWSILIVLVAVLVAACSAEKQAPGANPPGPGPPPASSQMGPPPAGPGLAPTGEQANKPYRDANATAADAPFTAEVLVDAKPVERFTVPFTREVESGDAIVVRINREQLSDPVLAVRVLIHNMRDQPRPTAADLRLLAGKKVVEPEITETRHDEVTWDLVYRLPAAPDEVRLEINTPYNLAIKATQPPVVWERQDGEYLKPNPLKAANLEERFAKLPYWIDNYNHGAYNSTHLRAPFERCTRKDDYLVVYFAPEGFKTPTLSVRIVTFNDQNRQQLEDGSFAATADGKPIKPKIVTATRKGDRAAEVRWNLPSNTGVAILRAYLPVRFQVAVSDGPFDWSNTGVQRQDPPPPSPGKGDGDAGVRISPTDNVPCFP